MKKSALGARNTEIAPSTPSRPLSKNRLAEILFRSTEILNSVGTRSFTDFVKRYSLNVRSGISLLRAVKKQYDPELHFRSRDFYDILSNIDGLESLGTLLEEGHLSIYDQLLQILARWRVDGWIVCNQDFILWCHGRRDYLPTLLTQYAGNPVLLAGDMVEQTLPAVDFLWLIELVGPKNEDQVRIQLNKVSSKISHPEYGKALLKFSAQLDQMNAFKTIISPLAEDSVESVLEFFQKRKSVFVDILAGRTNEVLDQYRQSNPQADEILTAILEDNKGLLVRLLNLRNRQKVLEKQAARDFLNPLIEQLQSLKSLITPLDTSKTFEMLQFFKANQNFFKVLALNYNAFDPAFRSYVDANPQAKDLIQRFQAHGQRLRRFLQVVDIQTVLTDPQAEEYFRPLVNDLLTGFFNGRWRFLAKISGINDQWPDRERAMVWVAATIEKYRDEMKHLVADKKEWRTWIKHHPEFQPIASEFRNALIQCVEGPVKLSEESFAGDCQTGAVRGCVDVRPGKARAFVPILTCLLEALGDLTEHDTVNAISKDVLLFNFVAHPTNHALLQFFYNGLQVIHPVLEAFLDHQNNKVDTEVPTFDPAVLRDQSNSPLSVDLHRNLKLKPLKPKGLRFNFQEPQQIRVEESTENQGTQSLTVRL